jgi:3-phytase
MIHRLPVGPLCGATLVIATLAGCSNTERPRPADSSATAAVNLPMSPDTLRPSVITDTLPGDSDDPAIWVNAANPMASLVLGTEKGDSTGGVYAFDLSGHIDRARSVTPLMRMNNVDIEYGLALRSGATDIAVATERRRQRLRVFALPEMRAIDRGGILVFDGDTARAPMGVALYRRPRDGAVFAIVGGKGGPPEGYLWQYRLDVARDGTVSGTKVRAFGRYSGRKEIEAILVDDALGTVYYSDEVVGVRKYWADPDSGNTELALFATTNVVMDHEGLAMYPTGDSTGYIILSDQGANRIHLFPREGTPGKPHDHPLRAMLPVQAQETDGLDVTARALGPTYPKGMLVMMSNRGAFHFYNWTDVEASLAKVRAPRP